MRLRKKKSIWNQAIWFVLSWSFEHYYHDWIKKITASELYQLFWFFDRSNRFSNTLKTVVCTSSIHSSRIWAIIVMKKIIEWFNFRFHLYTMIPIIMSTSFWNGYLCVMSLTLCAVDINAVIVKIFRYFLTTASKNACQIGNEIHNKKYHTNAEFFLLWPAFVYSQLHSHIKLNRQNKCLVILWMKLSDLMDKCLRF